MEHLVGYAKRDLTVPAEPQACALQQANRLAIGWCAEVNANVHSEICAVPVERPEAERALLRELPSLGWQIGPKPITREVDRLSCVRFGSPRYSVPTPLRLLRRCPSISRHYTRRRKLPISQSPCGGMPAPGTEHESGDQGDQPQHREDEGDSSRPQLDSPRPAPGVRRGLGH